MSELKPEKNYQKRLQSLSALAFEVVESLLTDTETPIEIRLNTAFRIVEMCSTTDTQTQVGQAIIKTIEDNALGIAQNAETLARIDKILLEQSKQ